MGKEELTALLRQHHHPAPDSTAHALWERLHQPQLQADAVTTRQAYGHAA